MICSRNFGGRLFRSASVASGDGAPRPLPDEVDERAEAVLGAAGEAHRRQSCPELLPG